MSDLYLILRRRLSDVVEWAEIGTDTLRGARKAKGLSYEAMGRSLHVVAKTWERWEKAGRVPRHLVPEVAELLSLEIETPAHRSVVLPQRDEVAAKLEEILASLGRLEQALLRGGQDGPTPRRAAG